MKTAKGGKDYAIMRGADQRNDTVRTGEKDFTPIRDHNARRRREEKSKWKMPN